MPDPVVAYVPSPDVTPEAEISALASVYKFVLDCHAKKNAASVTSTDGDDAKGSRHEVRANEASIPR